MLITGHCDGGGCDVGLGPYIYCFGSGSHHDRRSDSGIAIGEGLSLSRDLYCPPMRFFK